MQTEYPECEKMAAVKDQSQAIGEFIEWFINEKDVFVCRFDPSNNEYYVWGFDMEKILAEFFEIDLKKVETEKRQMLKELRENNGTENG